MNVNNPSKGKQTHRLKLFGVIVSEFLFCQKIEEMKNVISLSYLTSLQQVSIMENKINSKIKTLTNARASQSSVLFREQETNPNRIMKTFNTKHNQNPTEMHNKTKNEDKIIDIFAAMRLFVGRKTKDA